MNKRIFSIVALVLFLSRASANEQPNFIIILTDDYDYADIGFNGCQDIPTVLAKMRSLEAQWQTENRDRGLEDLGNRQPEAEMASVLVREAVKENAPELWARLEAGELMETQAWKKYLPKKKKK